MVAYENGHEAGEPLAQGEASTNVLATGGHTQDEQPIQAAPNVPTTGPLNNWLVWSDEDTGKLSSELLHDPAADEGLLVPEPVVATMPAATERVKVEDERRSAGIRWTWGRIAWSVGFAIVLAASLVFAVYGTQDRVSAGKRFPASPPFGTLDGLAFMQTAQYGPINSTGASGPVMIDLKYEYEAIKWLQDNVKGLHVIAEGPYEYYRDGGMNAAAYSGLPMVVGGLHQGEQRYDWLVGDRDGQMRQLYSTTDPQYALAVMSLFDIDYIYLGQLEKARAGDGLAKFDQLAQAGVLEKVFDSNAPEGITGATIYKVVKSPKQLAGAPVEGEGVAGISITPVPTSTPLPPPTPPTDNPELQGLIGAVAANPGDVDAHLALVEWYRNNNFWQSAADELLTTIKLRPKDVALRHMLGDAYQSAGQKDKAIKAWEDAVQVDPDNPATHNKVGIGYAEGKRYDDAIKAFQTAIAKDKNFVEAYYHLGEAYDAKGNRDEAKKAYQAAIDTAKAPDDPWAAAARERLANIK